MRSAVGIWVALVLGLIVMAAMAILGALGQFAHDYLAIIILLAAPALIVFAYVSHKRDQRAWNEFEQSQSAEWKANFAQEQAAQRIAAEQKARTELAKPSTWIWLILGGLIALWSLIRFVLWLTGLSLR